MRNLFLLFFVAMHFTTGAFAQEDPALRSRIDSILVFTKDGNFERMLDFTYPGIFTMASREELLASLEESVNTDEYTTSFDSVALVKVYPTFTIAAGSYALVHHSLRLQMQFAEPISGTQLTEAIESMNTFFGKEHTRFDPGSNSFFISMLVKLIAIKDAQSREWSFLNYRDDDPAAKLLLGQPVIDRIKALN